MILINIAIIAAPAILRGYGKAIISMRRKEFTHSGFLTSLLIRDLWLAVSSSFILSLLFFQTRIGTNESQGSRPFSLIHSYSFVLFSSQFPVRPGLGRLDTAQVLVLRVPLDLQSYYHEIRQLFLYHLFLYHLFSEHLELQTTKLSGTWHLHYAGSEVRERLADKRERVYSILNKMHILRGPFWTLYLTL